MENSYLEVLHYQQTLQLLNQQQQQNLWRLYTQQHANSYYSSTLANNTVSPSLSLWYAQNSSMIPSDYDTIPLMTQTEVM